MKPLNGLKTIALAAYVMVILSACGKTSNSSAPNASTPASTCTASADGTLRDSQGRLCNNAANTSTCPTTGYYVNSMGQQITCIAGQPINNGGPNGYPYPNNPNQTGCEYLEMQWHIPYVPIIWNGQYMCMRYDVANQYASGTQYYNNYDQYWQYPPYQNNGGGCNKAVAVSFEGFSGALCF